MQQTSLCAYYNLRNAGLLGEKQRLVLDAFKKNGPHTDLEISILMGFKDPNKIRPRRNELVKLGFLEEKGKKSCKISKKLAIIWGF